MPTNIRWKPLLAESVAVIASILIAFGIDAAWDSRLERAEVRETLAGIRTELLETQALVTEGTAVTLRDSGWLQEFYSGSEEEASRTHPDSAYVKIYLPLTRHSAPLLSTGFLDATIASGRLSLVPGDSTRAALAELAAAYESVDRMEVELTRLGAEAARLLGELDGMRRLREGFRIDPATLREIHQDERIMGALSARLIFFDGYLYGIDRRLGPVIERLLGLVERDFESVS